MGDEGGDKEETKLAVLIIVENERKFILPVFLCIIHNILSTFVYA